MHIDRKPSTVMTVIDRIYYPIVQKLGVSLLLRNEINPEMQFPPRFFINLIQITGNLIANALKLTPPNGFVEVVFTIYTDEVHRTLNVTVTDNGNIISPDLVAAINQSKQVAKLVGADAEDSIGNRLEYVMQLVSEESGCIFVKSEKDSGTKFSLSLPLPNIYMIRRNVFPSILNNDSVLNNGSQNSGSHSFS
jgi:signal transduction histidine kinase